MSDNDETAAPESSTSLTLLLGRQLMDGATPADLATRHEVSLDAVRAAWDYCQEALSRYLTAQDGEAYRLLTEDELRQRSLQCVRLLLHWREVANAAELLDTTTPGEEDGVDVGEPE